MLPNSVFFWGWIFSPDQCRLSRSKIHLLDTLEGFSEKDGHLPVIGPVPEQVISLLLMLTCSSHYAWSAKRTVIHKGWFRILCRYRCRFLLSYLWCWSLRSDCRYFLCFMNAFPQAEFSWSMMCTQAFSGCKSCWWILSRKPSLRRSCMWSAWSANTS